MPIPVRAETRIAATLPPQSSDMRLFCCMLSRTLSALASGRSILLMATMIGTPAAFAWFMASMVCGMKPSSAATTSTTMSVTFAPRARIAVNASCPGVSTKVMVLPLRLTTDAPICWVIPPASPPATSVLRMRSCREVLPWSTCPMKVTIGQRGTMSFGLSSYSKSSGCSVSSAVSGFASFSFAPTTSLIPHFFANSVATSGVTV